MPDLNPQEQMASLTMNRKRIVRDLFLQAWNHGQFQAISPYLGDAPLFHYRGRSWETGLEELKGLIAFWRRAFPDLRFEIINLVGEGDLVAANLVFTATHRGPWQDIPPTGRSIRVEEMMFFRFEEDKIVELWEVMDEFEMMNQLRGLSEV